MRSGIARGMRRSRAMSMSCLVRHGRLLDAVRDLRDRPTGDLSALFYLVRTFKLDGAVRHANLGATLPGWRLARANRHGSIATLICVLHMNGTSSDALPLSVETT